MTNSTNEDQAVGRLRDIVIDIGDLDRGAAFWGPLLGLEPGEPSGQYVVVGELSPGVRLILQRVPEAKAGKNRVHPDLSVQDIASAKQRVIALGGREVEELRSGSYVMGVMADPDGNEFCLLP